jgi:hypothetical protein
MREIHQIVRVFKRTFYILKYVHNEFSGIIVVTILTH